MVDLYLISTIAGVIITGTIGTFTIRNEIKKSKKEQSEKLDKKIESVATTVTTHIDKKLNSIDNKFDKVNDRIDIDEEDIQDIETQMKQLVLDAKETCDKLSKFDYIEKNVIPDFQKVIRDFYRFKAKLDAQAAVTPIQNNLVIKNDNVEPSNEQ